MKTSYGTPIKSLTIHDSFPRLTTGNLVYVKTTPRDSRYQWYERSGGACHLYLSPGTEVILHILELRGRLINAQNTCSYQLTLSDGTEFDVTCGTMHWEYRNVTFTARTDIQETRIDMAFHRQHESAEGRLLMFLDGRILYNAIYTFFFDKLFSYSFALLHFANYHANCINGLVLVSPGTFNV